MSNERFEKIVKPILGYIGLIGAVLMSVAYIICIFVLIKGFQYQQTSQSLIFAGVNAGVGIIIVNFLKYQGISFAKMIPENKLVEKQYYGEETKDKKSHSLKYYWVTTIIKDVFTKGCSLAFTTAGLIYIVIVGNNDWNLLLLAVVNLIMFICFGLLSLNNAYDYYNNTFVAYMNEKIKESNNARKNDEPRADSTIPSTDC